MSDLFKLVETYGTDKTLSGYTYTYAELFEEIQETVTSVLEVGVGTQSQHIPSTFKGNKTHFEHYEPGGSLRVWRDYFKNAKVYGIDIAEDCKISEDRIKTFLFDSSNKSSCDRELQNLEFDIIIDDGNHDPYYQIKTLENLLPRLKENGYYIIEDIGGYSGEEELLVDYAEPFKTLTGSLKVTNKGNHVIIHKVEKAVRESTDDYTIVSGLWNLHRTGRDFEMHYLPHFRNFLKIQANMILFIPKYLEEIVWSLRDKRNTFVKIYELDDIKQLYAPHWERTQKLRLDPTWREITGVSGWLTQSPQANLEYYNPIVQSKIFLLHDASIWNPFNTDYFFWLDAGITNTVSAQDLINDRVLDKLSRYANPFLFLSYPYESAGEIHGFQQREINRLAGEPVKYVCRGGLFGGHKDQIRDTNAEYYTLLQSTLERGYMGTEESLFTILAHRQPSIYRRYSLDSSGLIGKFTEALKTSAVNLEPVIKTQQRSMQRFTDKTVEDINTNLYILTFNFPEQLQHTIDTMKRVPEWLNRPKLVLLDNSTEVSAKITNKQIADLYNFEYIDLKGNKGICGGRQFAAEHFDKSNADFMFFFEDDMTVNSPTLAGKLCRNGFRKYIPNLYNIVHKIMLRENYDFLKLSYTEVYMDNNIQVSWYNVPQDIRTRDWPAYDKLPTSGLDPNAPRTKFNTINVVDEVSYVDGEIYYANWPMIVSREGNRKMFLETKWAYPFEQTWMSYMYQKTKKGHIKPAVLLASPIYHNRIKHYKPEERREN
jgi:hypothetical protein